MQLLVEMEYHILQVNLLTWLYFVNILCITPNISLQQIKMIQSDPCIMNEMMLAYIVTFQFSLKKLDLYCTRYTLYMLYGKCHSNPTNVGKCVAN